MMFRRFVDVVPNIRCDKAKMGEAVAEVVLI